MPESREPFVVDRRPAYDYQCTACMHIWEQRGYTTCCPRCSSTNVSFTVRPEASADAEP